MTRRWTLAEAQADAARRATAPGLQIARPTVPRPGAGPDEVRAAAREYVAQRFAATGEPVVMPARGEPGRFAALGAQLQGRRSAARRANAAKGRAARAAGESDEAAILAAAHAAGWSLRKMPTPFRRVGTETGGRFLAVYDDDAGCDFRGTVPGGRSVVVEAKGSTHASLPLEPKGKPVLRPRQRAELAECHALDGLAGVLVRVSPKDGDVWVWCPWPAWVEAEERARADGRASLSPSALVGAGAVVCEGGVAGWPAAASGRREV